MKFIYVIFKFIINTLWIVTSFIKRGKNSVYSNQLTIEKILDSDKSIIRLGDGEFKIMIGGSIYFQSFSLSLCRDLWKLVLNYKNNSNYILCVPDPIECKKKPFMWAPYLLLDKFYFSRRSSAAYYNSFVFRGESGLPKKVYLDIFNKYSTAVICHSNNQVVQDFFRLNKFRVRHVSLPPIDAYCSRHKIYNEIIKCAAELDYRDFIVMVSAGPTAKFLVYELSKVGIRALDVGHLFEK